MSQHQLIHSKIIFYHLEIIFWKEFYQKIEVYLDEGCEDIRKECVLLFLDGLLLEKIEHKRTI